jgi:DNA-binding CsgD family transcriptional regulator
MYFVTNISINKITKQLMQAYRQYGVGSRPAI